MLLKFGLLLLLWQVITITNAQPEPTTPRATPSPTPSPTPRPTPSPSPRPTPRPTPTPSPSPTPRHSPTPSPRPTPTPSPSPTPRPSPTPTTEPRITVSPITPAPCYTGRCTKTSPQVCGRNRHGNCRRFANVCDLYKKNCATPRRHDFWRRTALGQCARIAVGKEGKCALVCPRRPHKCPRRQGQQLCLTDRSRKQCRLVHNSCDLHNLNCFSKPRDNWRTTQWFQCCNMRVGEKPLPCTGCARG